VIKIVSVEFAPANEKQGPAALASKKQEKFDQIGGDNNQAEWGFDLPQETK
jgi:hypothetical protein